MTNPDPTPPRLAGLAAALLAAAGLWAVGCQQSPPPAAATAAAPATAAPAEAAAPAPVAKPADALASHVTNWAGVIADVTELRRKGQTLTAVIRLRNVGANTAVVHISYGQSYVLDEANARKYEVLTDDNAAPIAGPVDVQGLTSGSSMLFWMKFPAPPPEVRTVTLRITGAVPFEDLPIQEP